VLGVNPNADLAHQLTAMFFVALAVATVSMTATKAKISKPFRTWVTPRSKWFGELFSCPYCFSHYASVVAVAVVRPRPVYTGFWLVDLGISALAIVALSAFACGLIYKSIAATADPH